MKVQLYVLGIFCFFNISLAHSDMFANIRQQAEYWTVEKAREDAAQAIANKTIFLYSSGGFVCFPKADKKYKEFVKKMPVKTPGCGCTVLLGPKIPSLEYELAFNNLILEYVSKVSVAIERGN